MRLSDWPQVRHVVWDWNGTLLDDTWLCVDILNHLLSAHRLPPTTIDDYRRQFSFPVIHYYRLLGFSLENGSFHQLSEDFIRLYSQRCLECRLFDDVREALRLISSAGLGQSILSANRQDILESTVASYNLTAWFAHLSGERDIYATGKIEAGRALANRLSLPGQAILLIGDTLHDAEVASTLGWNCLLVSRGHNDHERLLTARHPVVNSLSLALTNPVS